MIDWILMFRFSYLLNIFLQLVEEQTEDDGEHISFTPQKWWQRLWHWRRSSKPKAPEKFGWIKGVLVSNHIITVFAVCNV